MIFFINSKRLKARNSQLPLTMEESKQQEATAVTAQAQPDELDDAVRVIPVIAEQVVVSKRMVETGKVRISKKVSEEQTPVSIPLVHEEYDVERVPVNEVVDTPPAAMRQEGDVTIIPVLREVMVVLKRYEIVEEIRITKRKTESTNTQQVSLRKEEINIERSVSDTNGNITIK